MYAQAEEKKEIFPIPAGNALQLFYLQRTENINTVIYELNYKNGILESKHPIHVFWILYADQGQQEELTELEKKFVYGIDIQSNEENEQYDFNLIAYPKISMHLRKDGEQKYQVYVNLSHSQLILKKAYIKIKEGGSRFKPDVEYIELSGIDAATGKEIIERVFM